METRHPFLCFHSFEYIFKTIIKTKLKEVVCQRSEIKVTHCDLKNKLNKFLQSLQYYESVQTHKQQLVGGCTYNFNVVFEVMNNRHG